MINIKTFNMDFYINSDFVVVKTVVSADVSMENEGEVLEFKLEGSFEIFNIDGVKSIDIPDVSPDEIMDLSEMFAPTMFE